MGVYLRVIAFKIFLIIIIINGANILKFSYVGVN
jgi:hypothetical protein